MSIKSSSRIYFDEFSPSILERYVSGTATMGERETVENWLASLSACDDYLSFLNDNQLAQLKSETFQNILSSISTKKD